MTTAVTLGHLGLANASSVLFLPESCLLLCVIDRYELSVHFDEAI